MTTTKTLLLLRQTLARAMRSSVVALQSYLDYNEMEKAKNLQALLPDIEQAIIEADREIERLEAEQEMDIAAP